MSRRNRNNLTWGLILVLFGGILLLNNYRITSYNVCYTKLLRGIGTVFIHTGLRFNAGE